MSRATSRVRGFAVRLINHVAKGDRSAGAKLPPAFRVCEKLRAPLVTLMGQAGFRALLARALALAGAEEPWLRALQVRADGSLQGRDQLPAQVHLEESMTANVVLVAELLGLLVAFIGEKLTLQLVHKAWPKLPAVHSDPGKGPTS